MTAQLDLATRIVERVTAAAPTAQAQAFVDTTTRALTRFANSAIHQNVADVTTTVRLTLHLDGRTVSSSTTLTSADALDDLVARIVAAARLAPKDPGWPGLSPVTPLVGAGRVDEAVLAATPTDRAERVRAFVDAAGGLTAAGYCQTRHVAAAYANSAGQAVAGDTTDASIDAIARTATSDGVARLAGYRLADLDGAVLGARAAAKARAGADPVELPTGHYEVVLEPTAVGDILQAFAFYGFDGRARHENRSFLRLGEDQFDPSVTIVDDPIGGGGLPFDLDGTPKRRIELVTAGRSAAAVYDLRTAALAGTTTTGHGLGGADGAFAVNIALLPAPGDPPPVTEVDGPAADSSVAALVAGVTRGVLVTDHWYTRVLDPRTLVQTGLTRNGVWLIENGEVIRPVRNFRFTQSYPEALGPGRVLGIGTHAIGLPNNYLPSALHAPALHLASWHFTGNSSG